MAEIRVHHDTSPAVLRPSRFRLFIGLLIVVLASSLLGFLSPDRWPSIVADIREQTGAEPFKGPALNEQQLKVLHYAVCGLLVIIGGLFLKRRLLLFIATGGLVAGTTFCVSLLISNPISWHWLPLVGGAAGYLLQCGSKPVEISIRGLIGWALIGFAAFACVRGWLDWSAIADKIGQSGGAFVSKHGLEFTWGSVLLLSAIGVACSKSRCVHLANAVILLALVYYCFHDGYVKLVDFSHLGPQIKPVPNAAIENIEPWRWAFMGTFVLICAVLMHMAVGIGGLTIAFAAIWLVAALQVDAYFGRLAFFRIGGSSFSATTSAADIESPDSFGVRGPFFGVHPAQTERGQRQLEAREQAVRNNVLIITPVVWTYLTAVLAGVIAVAGLRMGFDQPDSRWWLCLLLWFGLGVGLMWLMLEWPRNPEQEWVDWWRAWGILPEHRYAVALATIGAMSLFGAIALNRYSRYATWLFVAATTIFLGTALSLIGIALLIRLGGMKPLAVWSYVGVAVGQSSMMWVLLMHHNLRRRPVVTIEEHQRAVQRLARDGA